MCECTSVYALSYRVVLRASLTCSSCQHPMVGRDTDHDAICREHRRTCHTQRHRYDIHLVEYSHVVMDTLFACYLRLKLNWSTCHGHWLETRTCHWNWMEERSSASMLFHPNSRGLSSSRLHIVLVLVLVLVRLVFQGLCWWLARKGARKYSSKSASVVRALCPRATSVATVFVFVWEFI